jgi:hypothetical protein
MTGSMKIAVAGATGRVGSRVVDLLEANVHDVVPMSRSTGVDVVTGEGLAEALAGVECVIDASSGASADQQAASEHRQLGADLTCRVWSMGQATPYVRSYRGSSPDRSDQRARPSIVWGCNGAQPVSRTRVNSRISCDMFLSKMRTSRNTSSAASATSPTVSRNRARAPGGSTCLVKSGKFSRSERRAAVWKTVTRTVSARPSPLRRPGRRAPRRAAVGPRTPRGSGGSTAARR